MPLVRATPAPQILLREHEGFFPEEDTFGSLAVALDLEPSRTSLMLDNLREFLAQARKNPKITLLHALAPQSAEDAPEVLNAGRQALEEVRDEISSWGYETSAEIVSGDPSKELPARIRELAPSLLVIGLPVAGELESSSSGAPRRCFSRERPVLCLCSLSKSVHIFRRA